MWINSGLLTRVLMSAHRYIEYETNLAELLRLRKVAMGIPAGKGKGDTGITKRCHLLYERATRKFRGDLRLWLGWLEFCKDSDSTRQLSRASQHSTYISRPWSPVCFERELPRRASV